MQKKTNNSINSRMIGYETSSFAQLPGNSKTPYILCVGANEKELDAFISNNGIANKCESEVLFNSMIYAAYNCIERISGAVCCFVTFDAAYFCIMNTAEHKKFSNYITYASSLMTMEFDNALFDNNFQANTYLPFNAKLVNLPDVFEVKNYYIWRQIKHLRTRVYRFLEERGISKRKDNEIVPFEQLLKTIEEDFDWLNVSLEYKNGIFIRKYKQQDGSIGFCNEIAPLFGTKEGAEYIRDSLRQ